MSFKDDFAEALRSVKKDILGGSGTEEPSPAVRSAAPLNTSHNSVEKGLDFKYAAPPPSDIDDDTEENLEISDDIEVENDDITIPNQGYGYDYDSVELTAGGVHTNKNASFAGDDQPFGPSLPEVEIEPPETYSGYTPVVSGNMHGSSNKGGGDNGNGGGGYDGRQIFDFSADGVFDDEKTIISRNTVIRGALQTEDSVRLLGQVLGDIECKSNIVVAGKVRGNTSAANAYVVDAQVDGNMVCEDTISVNDDAWILGNIRARQAEVDGKIKGNLEIRNNISIGAASSVIGNISADELEIKRGAFINGQIIMYSPSRDVLDRFDRFEDGHQQP